MCNDAEVILIQQVCRLSECRKLFHICRSCYRGQCYCSRRCGKIARRRQLKAANLRYNQTPEARLDRNDRQRAWRQRQKERAAGSQKNSVMYQGSLVLVIVTVSVCQRFLALQKAILKRKIRKSHASGQPRCIICGRVGRFVNPFFIKRRYYP